MRNGPDTENLFHQLNIESFPYREFSDGRPPVSPSSGSGKWSTSLEILQREWIQATQTHAIASLPDSDDPATIGTSVSEEPRETEAPAARPAQAKLASKTDQSRVRLKRLFRREGQDAAAPGDSPLSDLFDRIR